MQRMDQGEPTLETLADLGRKSPGALDEEQARWVDRAAVLSWFTPALIGAPEDEDELLESEGWALLACQSEPVRISGFDRQRLALGPRREALQAMNTRGAMALALDETPEALRPDDRVQRAIERVLSGHDLRLQELSARELYGLEIVRSWFDGILPDLPSIEAVYAARIRKDLLAPHEALAAGRFYGRRDECEDLRSYVNELSNDRLLARLRGKIKGIARWFNDNPPLVIHGPGGVGKSSLVANFILEHAAREGFVFIDLDFGRPNIDSRSPATLLAEAARQVGAQVPGYLAEAQRVASDIEQTIKPADPSAGFLESAVVTEQEHAIGRFVRFARVALPEQNVPFVLDTFEEAMSLGETHTDAVLQLVADLQRELPRLRPIVCSRVRPQQSVSWLDIPLTEMDPQAAVEFVAARLKDFSNLPPDLADIVVKRINRTPLALNIAVELIIQAREQNRDPRDEIAKIASKADEAFLFDRLLKQIQGNDAHRLAFPGLIVRRLEPDLVLKVLKGPCGLSVDTREQALALLETLAAKVSLMEEREDDVFEHRPDVRRLMLRSLVENVSQATIDTIDRGAIDYFLGFDDPASKAEAAYHLLRIGDITQADALLGDPAVADHLRLAVDELDPSARLTLCLRLGISPSKSERDAADTHLWSRSAKTTAAELLRRGDYVGALAVARERGDVDSAEFDRIAAEALVGLGRWPEARAAAEQGLTVAKRTGGANSAITLALTLARIGFGQDDLDLAERALREVEGIVSEAIPIDLRVHLAVARLRVERLRGNRDGIEVAAHHIVELTDRDVLNQIVPSTLRELTGEVRYIQATAPELARRMIVSALFSLGFENEGESSTEYLAKLLREASLDSDEWKPGIEQIYLSTVEIMPPKLDVDPAAWSKWLSCVSVFGVGKLLASLLRVTQGRVRDEILAVVVESMSTTARNARERKLSAI